MTVQEAKKVIIDTIVEITGTEEEIAEDSLIVRDLGISSMQLLTMLSQLEDTFDVDLNMRKVRKLKTIDDLCNFIIKQL